MTPNFLVVLPDIVLAARLKSLIPQEIIATVGFAGSQEDGILALSDLTHLDLCIFCREYPDGDGKQLIAAVGKKFPRARLVVITDLSPEAMTALDPHWVALNLPLDIGQFAALCNETMRSLQGARLANFQIKDRILSDRWGDWYDAYDLTLKREVELGVLHAWATVEECLRFREVARLRASAIHDHVQTVFFGGNHSGRDFVSYEKWENPSLPELLDSGQKIDVRIAARILHTVASVLAFWDSHEYPHPPLTPSDVSVSIHGVVKVKNVVDPSCELRPSRVSDLLDMANIVYGLLPSLEKIPRSLREVLNKIRASEQVVFETSLGEIVVALDRVQAPLAVANFLAYVDRQLYDDTLFHHVIAGFVLQGGRYNCDMIKIETDKPIPNEASNGLLNLRGTLSMAHGDDPNSATSQFILNLVDNSSLDPIDGWGGYTVFGKVIEGMDVVDRIAGVEVMLQDKYYLPVNPVVIFRAARRTSMTLDEVIGKTQILDMQPMEGSLREVAASNESTWLSGMASSKALASMSKAITTLTGSLSLKKKSSASIKNERKD